MFSSFLLKKNISFKKLYLIFLKNILNKYIKNIRVQFNSILIKGIKKNIYPLCFFLNKHTNTQYNLLTDIICYDCPGKKYRFLLIYNLLGLNFNYRIKIQTKLKEKTPMIMTLISLYPGAGWLEREVWDLFGVYFLKNVDLRRILMDYGFIGYPLRKDFPLTGFFEAVYDDLQKQIIYQNLNLVQDFRTYRFKNIWNESN